MRSTVRPHRFDEALREEGAPRLAGRRGRRGPVPVTHEVAETVVDHVDGGPLSEVDGPAERTVPEGQPA